MFQRGPLGPPAAPTRVAAICVIAAAISLFGRAGGATWLCVPLAMLACAACATPRGAVLAAGAAAAAGLAPALVVSSSGRPSAALLLLVLAGCAAVLIVVRERLVRESAALRGYALSDPLTGIANRRSLLICADYEVARHHRAGRSFALTMLDLDGFKALNDRFGHPAGDDLLRNVAASLQRVMRGQDTVARFGGDEFCVLAPETDEKGTERLATRIAQAVSDVTVGVEMVRASLGIAVFPDDGGEPSELLQTADQRLLEAKRRRAAGRQGQRRVA